MKDNPEFIVITGPMFSSKTTELFTLVQKCTHRHKKFAAFKPSIDNRYGIDNITSHDGLEIPAMRVKDGSDILEFIFEGDDSYDIVVVDEAFMIPNVAKALKLLFSYGYSIYVATLDLSATGKNFREVNAMLPWATKIEKRTAVCSVCSQDANYSYKRSSFSNSDSDIEVGGAEEYEARCFSCHPRINERDK